MTTEDKKVDTEEAQEAPSKPAAKAKAKPAAKSKKAAGETAETKEVKEKKPRAKKAPAATTDAETKTEAPKKAAAKKAAPKKAAKADVEEPEAPAAEEKAEKEAPADELKVTFSIEIKNEDIEAAFNEAVTKYAGEIKLPGFRQGKVPLEVIRSRFNDAINDEVLNKLAEEKVFEKIQKDKLKIIAAPRILSLDRPEGKNAVAEVEVDVMPEVVLPDFETLEVEIPAKELEIKPYDEKEALDRVLESNRRQSPVINRDIKDEDMVSLKYQSKILATKRMTPMKTAQYNVKEENDFDIIDLYKDITGKKIDDKLTVKRTYPEDYKKKPWAGKEVEHYITIESVFEMVKPEFDDTFAKSQGFKDQAEFKSKMKEEYESYSQKQVEEKRTTLLVDKLVDAVDFPVPPALVQQELMRMMQQNQFPMDFGSEAGQKIMEMYRGSAERSVKFSFIVGEVTDRFKIDVKNDDLEAEYKRIAEANNIDAKEVRKFYLKKENREQLEDVLMRNKVMDLLKEKIKVKEV